MSLATVINTRNKVCLASLRPSCIIRSALPCLAVNFPVICSHDLTPESVGIMIRFLYGIQPDITAENARSLLFTSAYFGVPTLLSR